MTTPLKTLGVLFAGGGGKTIGAMAAGLTPLWSVEIDPEIAHWGQLNTGSRYIVQPVECVDVCDLPAVDVLMASPPCQSHSIARSKKLARRDDEAVGIHILKYTRVLSPRLVVIENVPGYAKSEVFTEIVQGLRAQGYTVQYDILNSADYAVPQTRRRLILRAVLGGPVPPLVPTHCDPARMPAPSLFDDGPLPWVGWYEAIEDLIPTLPESRFAEWQLKRLPSDITETLLVEGDAAGDRPPTCGTSGEPAFTLKTDGGGRVHRAFLHMTGNTQIANPTGTGILECSRPANTVCGNSDRAKAFLMSNAKTEFSDGLRPSGDPAFCTTAEQGGRLRAFIADGQTNSSGDDITVRADGEHRFTISASASRRPARALLVGDQYGQPSNVVGRSPQVAAPDEPAFTVRALGKGGAAPRAWLSQGRVVSITPPALAAFQSVPKWYKLPPKASLACRIIGNMVPPLLARRIIEAHL